MRLQDQTPIMYQRAAPIDAANRVPADLHSWQCKSPSLTLKPIAMSIHDTAVTMHTIDLAHLKSNNEVLLSIPPLIPARIEGAAGAHPLLQVPSHIPQHAATLWWPRCDGGALDLESGRM